MHETIELIKAHIRENNAQEVPNYFIAVTILVGDGAINGLPEDVGTTMDWIQKAKDELGATS